MVVEHHAGLQRRWRTSQSEATAAGAVALRRARLGPGGAGGHGDTAGGWRPGRRVASMKWYLHLVLICCVLRRQAGCSWRAAEGWIHFGDPFSKMPLAPRSSTLRMLARARRAAASACRRACGLAAARLVQPCPVQLPRERTARCSPWPRHPCATPARPA